MPITKTKEGTCKTDQVSFAYTSTFFCPGVAIYKWRACPGSDTHRRGGGRMGTGGGKGAEVRWEGRWRLWERGERGEGG